MHINQYGSRHTDVIVTEDATLAAHFQSQVDAAGVCGGRGRGGGGGLYTWKASAR